MLLARHFRLASMALFVLSPAAAGTTASEKSDKIDSDRQLPAERSIDVVWHMKGGFSSHEQTALAGKTHGVCALRPLTDLDFARQAKTEAKLEINRSIWSERGSQRPGKPTLARPNAWARLVATKSKLRGEEDVQPHAHCIFLNGVNNPFNIDFYASFWHSPPRGSVRFRLEPPGRRPEGREAIYL